MLKRTVLAKSLLIAFGGNMLGVGYAFAQDAQPAAGQQLERVTVTGSNIRRVDTETPSPVQVINAEQMKQSGYTSVAQVLQNITANGAGTLSPAFPGAFAGSASGISLRGLTTASTLVLIDGHRMAPFPLGDDNQRSFVDISSIPFDAVERIEVLKDGASAVYGSDAMAGVVNIILKKTYVGTTVSAEVGRATEGGGFTTHASVMHGLGSLDADGYNAYVNLEYRRQNDITQMSRQGRGQWSQLDQTNIGGINQTPGVVSPNGPSGLTPATYGTVYLQPPGKFSASNSYFYNAPIAPNPAYNGNCTYALLQTGGCAFVNPQAEVQPATENINVIGSFNKRLAGDWLLNVKASLFDSKGEQYNAGSTANGLTVFPRSFVPLVAVSAGSPVALVGTTIPAVTVPVGYPGNPFTTPARIRGVSLDAPAGHDDFESKSYRLVGTLSGNYASWDLDASVGYTRVDTDKTVYGSTNVPVLNAALNRTSNPFLITGGNTAADIAAVYPTLSVTDSSVLEFAEINASRTLMELPGGNLGFSAGGQYIHRSVDAPAPDLVAQGIVSGNNAFVKGSQSDTAVYAEVSVPVFKMLELDGHLRYDHFSNAGNATTPSVGFKFTPVEQFAMRGTIGKGFRAPNAAESGQAGNSFSAGTQADPVLCPNGASAAGAVISQCNVNLNYLNTANSALKAERSVSSTIGFILEPIKGWSTTFDFYQVTINDQIVTVQSGVDKAVRSGPVTDNCSDGNGGTVSCTVSQGEIIYIPSTYDNLNSTKVKGWELETRYKFGLGGYGNLTAQLDWSHTMSFVYTATAPDGSTVSSQLAGTHGPGVIGGNTGNPKDRIQASLTYDRGPLLVTTTLNWISSFDLTDPSGSNFGNDPTAVTTCDAGANSGGYFASFYPNGTPPGGYCRVASFFTTDVYAKYQVTKNWTIHGSVNNLLNRQPPLDLNTYGGGNLPYNPSMHQAGAVGRFVNVGASYTF